MLDLSFLIKLAYLSDYILAHAFEHLCDCIPSHEIEHLRRALST